MPITGIINPDQLKILRQAVHRTAGTALSLTSKSSNLSATWPSRCLMDQLVDLVVGIELSILASSLPPGPRAVLPEGSRARALVLLELVGMSASSAPSNVGPMLCSSSPGRTAASCDGGHDGGPIFAICSGMPLFPYSVPGKFEPKGEIFRMRYAGHAIPVSAGL